MSAVRATAVRAAARPAGAVPERTAPHRATSPVAPVPRPRLSVVRAPAHHRTRVPFVLMCMGLLAVSLLAVLLLKTSMATGSYERFALQSRLAESVQRQQQVAGELQQKESAGQLAAAATALGMVPSTHGAYLRLSDGAVLGDPVPAGAGG